MLSEDPIGYVSAGELAHLKLGASCIDLFRGVAPNGLQMVPLYEHPSDGLEHAIAIIAARLPLYTDIGQINALRECISSIRSATEKTPLQPFIVGWIYEDELPESYPYDEMFQHSKVDGVRMFPVYAPSQADDVDLAGGGLGPTT